MSDVPDPEAFLGELKGNIYQDLIQKLKKDESWRKLAAALPIFDEEKLEYETCPSLAVLIKLGEKMFKVKNLRNFLLKCDLRDAAAVLSKPRTLSIEKQPGENENDLYVCYGGELQLEIKACGVPPPRYLWYCDNKELADQKKSVLQIGDFGPQHEGEYKCLVSQDSVNGFCQEFSTPVNVLMLPEPPVIQEQPKPASVRVGEEVILSCRVVSYPPPRYQWMCDNTVLESQNDCVLEIPHASVTDMGIYKCCISSGPNNAVTKGVKLSVYEFPLEQIYERTNLPIVEEKVALLIANAAYDQLSTLHTPYNDVKALSAMLQELGFKVLALCDLTLIEMMNAVKTFCNLLPEGAYAIFYFVGHGFELHEKYMLSVECPTPDLYRRSDSLCERYVIREVLAKKPHLLLLMLDMCLKLPKKEENPGIYDEQIVPIPYEPQRNLIQAYATTSNLGAYERKNETNGIYMKHLLKFLAEDVPVVDILQKVIASISEEAADAVNLQMPAYATNVAYKHYLTVPARENHGSKMLFNELTHLQDDEHLFFPGVNQWSSLKFKLYQNCFHNAVEVHFHNLQNWSVAWETQSMDLVLKIDRDNDVKVLKVLNLQKLKQSSLPMTVALRDTTGKLVDNAWFDINSIPITSAHLWFKPPDVVDSSEGATIESLSYESSAQCVFSGEINTEN